MSSLPTIADALARFRAGQQSPCELLDDCLQRIGQLDGKLFAWVLVDEAAARSAARESSQRWWLGQPRGALDGVPLGVKDIFDVAGWPTLCGSSWRPRTPATADAKVVAALRRAGAVIVGKTATAEFACFDPPATCNPWNLSRTPGGSSSGSAVAVATGMCLAALGTQTGGSVIRPAAYCGIVGCKPTFGKLSRDGVFPVSEHLDHVGFFTRTAADAALVCNTLSSDGGTNIEPRISLSAPEKLANLLRLGRVGGFFQQQASDAVRTVCDGAIGRLQSVGAIVEPRELPAAFDDILTHHRRIMAYEAAAVHRTLYAQHRSAYGPCLASLIDEGLAISPAEFQASLAGQTVARLAVPAMFADCDVLLMPSTNSTAPDRSTTGDPRFNSPWSFVRLPAVTIPCGLADDGLPVGLQLVAAADNEAALLRCASWCEQITGFTAEPPTTATRV